MVVSRSASRHKQKWDSAPAFRTTEVRKARADAETVAEFLSRTGYDLPVAVADLIDNSLDAEATQVHVSLVLRDDRPWMLVVADNGTGMDPAGIEAAVSLAKDPRKQDGRHLGRYGAGLKAASFSLGRVLHVVTKTAIGSPLGVVLDRESYKRDYEYEVLEPHDAARLFEANWGDSALGNSGTVVLIQDLVSMVPASDSSQDLFLRMFGSELDTRLGLVFHRYIDDGRLKIGKSRREIRKGELEPEFDVYNVEPVNPFAYPRTGKRGYPKRLIVKTDRSSVPVRLHLWPKQGRTKATRHPNYEILGRSGEWQGLYFYRWDRMLQAGGWNGLRSQEPHMSYARIEVDLPHGTDAEFRPTITKDRIENARPLLESLMRRPQWSAYIAAASTIYRGKTSPAIRKRDLAAKGKRPERKKTKFVTLKDRPSVRVSDGAVQIDRRVVRALGRENANAVSELVWLALRDNLGRKRLSPELRQDLEQLEAAVARLAGRGPESDDSA